jgi:hypothetical protein
LYFTIKLFCFNVGMEFKYDVMLVDLRNLFMEKFTAVTAENFNRAFNLIKNVEKNAEINGAFEKENIVNSQITQHLVEYIKIMSLSFVDLNEEFGTRDINSEGGVEIYNRNDRFIIELQETYCNLLIDNYFIRIFSKLDHLLHSLSTDFLSGGENLNVQKFYFYYYILYQMDNVFISFLNSNVSFLTSTTICTIIEDRMKRYMNQFYSCYFNRITQELKILIVNKDDFSYLYVNIVS